jgi:hypothetical protein
VTARWLNVDLLNDRDESSAILALLEHLWNDRIDAAQRPVDPGTGLPSIGEEVVPLTVDLFEEIRLGVRDELRARSWPLERVDVALMRDGYDVGYEGLELRVRRGLLGRASVGGE